MRAQATVLHVDLDAFFVSMELTRRPELKGLPVVVGGLGNRGVVTTCSYEARAFGVRSAMPISQARRLCPQAVYLPGDYSLYGPASKQFHAILRDFTPLVESGGADEAYLDVAGCDRLFGTPEDIAKSIRAKVKSEIGIAASVGVSTSKLVSKVASDASKPDGLLVVAPGAEATFLAPRPLRDLPMIGPKTAEALTRLGLKTLGDLQTMPVDALVAKFGPHARELQSRALGIDPSPVSGSRWTAKSVSRESTFGQDVSDPIRLHALIRGQAERIAADLDQQERSARTVSLKLRFPPFETHLRSATQPAPIDLADEIYEAATSLFDRLWSENDHRPVRLIGTGVSNIVQRARQMRLGEHRDIDRLAGIVGDLRSKFGDSTIIRAAELGHRGDSHDEEFEHPWSRSGRNR